MLLYSQCARYFERDLDSRNPGFGLIFSPKYKSKPDVSFRVTGFLDDVNRATIMMFAPPMTSFHSWHRGAWKLFGKLPK